MKRLGRSFTLALASALCLACKAPASPTAPGDSSESRASSETPEEPVSVRPGVNDGYRKKPVEDFVDRFESEGREVHDERERIMAECGFEAGLRVVDVGAGTGLFMPLLSEAVGPEGRVTAVDITPSFVERLQARATEYDNVDVMLGDPLRLELPPASQDVAFMVDVYHHIEYPPQFMRSVYETLAPGGELIVIDFRRIEGVTSVPMLKHVRAGQEVVRAEIEAVGFELVESKDWMRENYFMRFRRR